MDKCFSPAGQVQCHTGPFLNPMVCFDLLCSMCFVVVPTSKSKQSTMAITLFENLKRLYDAELYPSAIELVST